MLNMVNIIISAALKPCQNHVGSFKANRAVRGIRNIIRGFLNKGQRIYSGCPVQNLLQQILKLQEAYTAGHAFAAGLCMTQLQKGQLQVDRAKPRRAGNNMAFQILVQPFHS